MVRAGLPRPISCHSLARSMAAGLLLRPIGNPGGPRSAEAVIADKFFVRSYSGRQTNVLS
jgi:hypothetical protein